MNIVNRVVHCKDSKLWVKLLWPFDIHFYYKKLRVFKKKPSHYWHLLNHCGFSVPYIFLGFFFCRRTSLGESVSNLTKLIGDFSQQTVLFAICTALLMTCMYFSGKWIGSHQSNAAASAVTEEELLMMNRNNDFLEVSKILNDPKTTNLPHLVPMAAELDEEQPEIVVPNVINTKDIYNGGWLRNCSSKCQGKTGPLVLSVVISAPSHTDERQAIRKGWGSFAAKSKHSSVVYLVGVPPNRDPDDLDRLLQESDLHGDLVITNNVDSYNNLTLKTIAAFKWAQTFCNNADFVLKTDDDMFVQVRRLLATAKALRKNLRALSPHKQQPMVLGNIASGWKPVRNPESKYFITQEQYDGATYPPFATGPSYLVTRSAIDLLVEEALHRPFFHLEDVFITGIVAETVGVPRRLATEFRNNATPIPVAFLGCTLLRTISIHKVKPKDQAKLAEMARDPQCGRGDKQIKMHSP